MTVFGLMTVLWLRLHTGLPFPMPIDYPGAPEGSTLPHNEQGQSNSGGDGVGDLPPH